MSEPRSVVFLNRFYWPDVAATGQMLADLAEDLAANDWQVTVITSRIGYSGSGAPLPREEVHKGVRIIRVSTTAFGRDRLIGRMGDYASYLVGAFYRLVRLRRVDALVAMSDPPFLLVPVLAAGRIRRTPVVYWLQDMYPQLAAKLGALRERGLVYRLLDGLARRLHGACDAVVTLGPQMSRAIVAAGAREEQTAHVHNWADAQDIRPVLPEANPFVERHGLAGKFVVLYSGNAGRAHTFDSVIEAIRRLRDDPDVVFLFIGGGNALPHIRAVTQDERLSNVRFLDYLPRAEIRYSLSAASVSLVTEAPDVVGLLVPSKTYGILASGRPLLFVGSCSSDVATIVRESGAGIVVPPDDPTLLIATILRMKADLELREEMGRRARHAAETLYDRRIATAAWSQTVDMLLWQDGGERGAGGSEASARSDVEAC